VLAYLRDPDCESDPIHEPRAKKKTDPYSKYKMLQIDFKGNLTTMRNHIRRQGLGHFCMYQSRCKEKNISINVRAIPKGVQSQARDAADGGETTKWAEDCRLPAFEC
jgi:hypothetical protein